MKLCLSWGYEKRKKIIERHAVLTSLSILPKKAGEYIDWDVEIEINKKKTLKLQVQKLHEKKEKSKPLLLDRTLEKKH